MKILVYVNDDVGRHSGITRYVDYMAQILQRAGHQPLIVGNADDAGAFVTESRTWRGNGFLGKLRTAFFTWWTAVWERYPVVLFTQLAAPLNGVLAVALRLSGKRLVYVCMDPPPEILELLMPKSALTSALVRYLVVSESIVDRCSDVTFSISPGVDKLLRDRGWRGRIRRFYNVHGAEVTSASPPARLRIDDSWKDATILVYAGRLQQGLRGIEHQFEALALARKGGANVRMVAVGHGETPYFRDLADRLGIAGVVRFIDAVPPDELSGILDESDVAVFASLPYALPSKVFEYIAHGLRLLSVEGESDVNDISREFVETYDGTPEGLARVLASLHRDNERSSLQHAARFLGDLRKESAGALLEEIKHLEAAI